MYRLLIVDDEYLVRLGLRKTIDWEALGLEIVGESSNGEQGLLMAEKLKPDLIISDVKMPLLNGVEMVAKLQKTSFDGRIIMLSGYRDFDYAKETFEHGVFAYVLKPVDNGEIIDVVTRALNDLKVEREQHELYKGLKEQMPNIRQQIIKDIIGGNISHRDDIIQKLLLVNLPPIETGHLILVKLDDSIDENLLKDIEAIMTEHTKYIERFSLIFEHFVLLIIGEINEKIGHTLKLILHEYQIKHQETITLTATSFSGLSMIHDAYLKAQQNVATKLFLGINTIESDGKDRLFYKKTIGDALNYISKEYANNISIKQVAEYLKVSDSHLMHLFKSDIGKTFNEVLTGYRIEKAKQLLSTGAYRVFEVSSMVGYQDEKYFSSVFKKNTGLMPSAFLKETNKLDVK